MRVDRSGLLKEKTVGRVAKTISYYGGGNLEPFESYGEVEIYKAYMFEDCFVRARIKSVGLSTDFDFDYPNDLFLGSSGRETRAYTFTVSIYLYSRVEVRTDPCRGTTSVEEECKVYPPMRIITFGHPEFDLHNVDPPKLEEYQ